MSSELAGLLVVADADDEVALEVKSYLSDHERTAVVMPVAEAAQLFTITADDLTVAVEPDLPMLLRLPPPDSADGPDMRFHEGECLAQLWAAAALMASPVINRPHPRWFTGAVSPSAVVTGSRAGVAAGVPEVFSATPPPPYGASGEQWWVQDLSTLTVAPWPQPPGAGPYRGRWSDADPAFESVVTFAGKAWPCTNVELDHLDLVPRSLSVSEALGLTLAAVVWRISPHGATAELVHVEPFPSLEQLKMVWLGFGPRLLEVIDQ